MLTVFTILATATIAQSDDVPRLLEDGDYQCRISNEYRFRGCTVVSEGDEQSLTVDIEGHLLLLVGRIHAPYNNDDKKLFVEARLKEAKPYVCSTSDPAAQKECAAQPLMIVLKPRGEIWSGSFPIKHYWNKYAGEGAERQVVGTTITVTELSFTLRPVAKKP
ncbi:MAG: hypothetical protein H0U74_11305 [Bradymonadaceae bacterium]|nr:hypothetical protein [Lujinxingiaceae bacterium]